jgi:hypothetical protein
MHGVGDLKAYATGLGVSNFEQLVPRLWNDAKAVGTNVVYLWDYWQGGPGNECAAFAGAPYFCKGDYVVREDLGGLESLRAGIDSIHADGTNVLSGRAIVYLEPFILGFGANLMKAYSDLFWARKPGDGLTRGDGLVWEPFGNTVALSYAHSGWQDRLVDIARFLVRELHADGVFLDSGAWRMNERVETKDEIVAATPREHAAGFIDLVKRVRNAIQLERADAVVLTETASGPISSFVDGAVTSDFSPTLRGVGLIQGRMVATPTRYARANVNLFSAGADYDSRQTVPPILPRPFVPLSEMNQVYAAGHNLALGGRSLESSKAYLKRLVTMRQTFADALIEGQQRDLVTNDFVLARQYIGTTNEVITVVNVGATPATATLDFHSFRRGTRYCDIVSNRTYTVGLPGTLALTVDPAPADQTCAYPTANGAVCGLRVLVRIPGQGGTCPAP